MTATPRSRDRDILKLAIPALGALAAEPTYLLVDTAIVGHLGTTQLAALGLAATFLASTFWVFNFLAYGTTAQVARLHGAGDREGVASVTAQAVWLAIGIGIALFAFGQIFTPQIVSLLQGSGAVGAKAETYMRISFIGAPMMMIVLAGEGWARGVQRMVVPLKILVAANVLNIVLDALFVYGFEWDVAGSAWATVISQTVAAIAFAYVLRAAIVSHVKPVWARMRPLIRVGGNLMVRTGALLLCFNVVNALLASKGAAGLAANQVLLQLMVFIALVLDSFAVAAQSLVGSRLGADDAEDARAYSLRVTRMCLITGLFVASLLALGNDLIPQAFTSSEVVLDEIARAWWLFVGFIIFSALVFGWDGVLMGAGDMSFLMWAMLTGAAACLPIAFVLIGGGEGIVGAWIAFSALNAVRFATAGWRVLRGRWAITGLTASG